LAICQELFSNFDQINPIERPSGRNVGLSARIGAVWGRSGALWGAIGAN